MCDVRDIMEVDSDDAMFTPGSRSGFVYDLFCVIVHEGTLNTGHYWSFCKWQDQVSAVNGDLACAVVPVLTGALLLFAVVSSQ